MALPAAWVVMLSVVCGYSRALDKRVDGIATNRVPISPHTARVKTTQARRRALSHKRS